MITLAFVGCYFTSVVAGIPEESHQQALSTHPYIWKAVTCQDLIQTLSNVPNVDTARVGSAPGTPVFVFQVDYRFSPKLAMAKGTFTVSLYPSWDIDYERDRRVNRHFSSIPSPPKMVDLSKTHKVQGFALFDDVQGDPLFGLGWAAFVRVESETKVGLEMKIVTSGRLNLDEDGKPVYLPDGKPDRLPLAKEHSLLAAAILKEVFEQGKRLNIWKGE